MKKIIIALLGLLLCVVAYSQSIAVREDADDHLIVGTNYRIAPRMMGALLACYFNKLEKSEGWMLGILLYSDREFDVDFKAKVLIKTFKDNVIELINESSSIQHDRDYPYAKSHNYDIVDYQCYINYKISTDDLKILMSEGIKKMRFETTRGFKDIQWEEDVFGKILSSEYNLVLKEHNFESGF